MDLESLKSLQVHRGYLEVKQKCNNMQIVIDGIELQLTKIKIACNLVCIAFQAGIPMNQIRNMVVTDQGIVVKGQNDGAS